MPLTFTASTAQTPPQNFLLLLYPCHQLLDSAGPLDILSSLTKLPQGANLTLTIAAESLDPIDLSPRPPPSAPFTWQDIPELPRATSGPGFGGAGFNPRLIPDITFEQALKDLSGTNGNLNINGDLREIDVVLIPGGIGSRMTRIYQTNSTDQVKKISNVASVVSFITALNEGDFVRHAYMTVCTGSDILARTGLLDGRRATTNVRAFDGVKGRNPGVNWLEKRRWVRSLPGEVASSSSTSTSAATATATLPSHSQSQLEAGVKLQPETDIASTTSTNLNPASTASKSTIDREIWTSAGISAGMDLMFWFVAEVWSLDIARTLAGRLEYEWREGVGEGERDPFYA